MSPQKAQKNPKKARIPKCPMCGQPLPYDLRDPNPPGFFPFCSQKCKLIDLHKWLSEEYYISSPIEPRKDEEKPSNRK